MKLLNLPALVKENTLRMMKMVREEDEFTRVDLIQ